MHSFEVHTNEIAYRKRGRLGMEQVYIKNVCGRIDKLIVTTLKNYGSPLDSGNHSEIYESDLLPPNYIPIYRILIGCLQWAVTLGLFNVQYATNILDQFFQNTCEGNLKRSLQVS